MNQIHGRNEHEKFLSALLMLTVLLTAAPTTAFAAEVPVKQATTDICYIDDLVIETVLTVYDSTWSFASANAWESANKAYGSYTLIRSTNGQTVSGNVVITCSPTGTIS